MHSQLDLLPAKAPTVSPDEVHQVRTTLRGSGWLKSPILLARLRKLNTDTNQRWLRAVSSASKGLILSYPGSPGYRLTREATLDEIQRARCILDQADAMRQHWLDIERVYHAKP